MTRQQLIDAARKQIIDSRGELSLAWESLATGNYETATTYLMNAEQSIATLRDAIGQHTGCVDE